MLLRCRTISQNMQARRRGGKGASVSECSQRTPGAAVQAPQSSELRLRLTSWLWERGGSGRTVQYLICVESAREGKRCVCRTGKQSTTAELTEEPQSNRWRKRSRARETGIHKNCARGHERAGPFSQLGLLFVPDINVEHKTVSMLYLIPTCSSPDCLTRTRSAAGPPTSEHVTGSALSSRTLTGSRSCRSSCCTDARCEEL